MLIYLSINATRLKRHPRVFSTIVASNVHLSTIVERPSDETGPSKTRSGPARRDSVRGTSVLCVVIRQSCQPSRTNVGDAAAAAARG